MKRRASALLAAALAACLWLACPGGLLVDKGNNFPCDFSQPEGARDAVCAPGDVCGVDNLCREFRYEGPQFEANASGAPLPDFSTVQRLHPGLLDQPVLFLTQRSQRLSGPPSGVLLVGDPASTVQSATLTLGLEPPVVLQPFSTDLAKVLSGAEPGDWVAVALDDVTGGVTNIVPPGMPDGVPLASVRTAPGLTGLVRHGERLRSGQNVALLLRPADVLLNSSAGEFDVLGQYNPVDVDGGELDGGVFYPLEARYLPLSSGLFQDLLLLGDEGFFLRRNNRVSRVTDPGVTMPALRSDSRPTLRGDVTGAVWAFTRLTPTGWSTLSTWRLDTNGISSMARLWNDCTPCATGRMVAFVPVLNGAPEVQVICATKPSLLTGPDETLSLTRVVGSAAIDETEACLIEPADAPFALDQVNFVAGRFLSMGVARTDLVQDDATGVGIVLGGERGQIWAGDSLTDALPFFLERTPLAFGTFSAPDGGLFPVALTDRYLAVPRDPDVGFEVLDVHKATSVPLAEDVVVSAMMGLAPGWGILSTGDLAFVGASDAGHFALSFGPRLVDGRGAPALSPFFAEGALDRSQPPNIVSFVMTANDSLYFTPLPPLSDTQNIQPPVTPQLTPAPGSPIRSMTLERSAIGTDGISKVRGYLIAGRQLFVFTLAGSPPRWAATPIVLQGGEPVEVWMDNPLGGLGRVGYRDGEIFTLPGGFLLVNSLPRGDGGMAPQVLDYENLGGWPVAMTSNGLFEAQWPKDDAGIHLLNRFPDGGEGKAMDWTEVALPDGGRPWLNQNGRLQVVDTVNPADGGHLFELLVYTDDQVLEFGTLLRK